MNSLGRTYGVVLTAALLVAAASFLPLAVVVSALGRQGSMTAAPLALFGFPVATAAFIIAGSRAFKRLHAKKLGRVIMPRTALAVMLRVGLAIFIVGGFSALTLADYGFGVIIGAAVGAFGGASWLAKRS
jgi:hypothetical protein